MKMFDTGPQFSRAAMEADIAALFQEYRKLASKGKYKKAHACLEDLHRLFPDDIELIQQGVHLCLKLWDNPGKARKWLRKLTKLRRNCGDHLALGSVEAELGNLSAAKGHLGEARSFLEKYGRGGRGSAGGRDAVERLESFIAMREAEISGESEAERTAPPPGAPPVKRASPARGQGGEEPATAAPVYDVSLKIEPFDEKSLKSLIQTARLDLRDARLLADYTRLSLQKGYDELLSLPGLRGVEKYWYQIETVKKVLKNFHGRVLLCDEVGLGKTVEAGILLKEYLTRNMLGKVLVLVPTALVSQWKDEMLYKFGMDFRTTDEPGFSRDGGEFWKNDFIIASINAAKSKKNFERVSGQFYDLVIVDEAHHLRNKNTLNWKLVNRIRKKFIFLLTATPVQNNLMELFNLITLLKPGQFKTEKIFKKEYMKKGSLKPSEKDKLNGLLREVMIRNTRSVIDLKLPGRYATSIRAEPGGAEREVYSRLDGYLRGAGLGKMATSLLLRQAGSSPRALEAGLAKRGNPLVRPVLDGLGGIRETAKAESLLKILSGNPSRKKIIFTQFQASVDYIKSLLERRGHRCASFTGGMSLSEKDEAVARFRDEVPVLVSTEVGGEGRNMQFCSTIINFDLPWNPMKIEQRIGRLHRIGQEEDVFIFNLSTAGTIEDYILEILDGKINMFEMVIGEIEPILGYLDEEKEFEELIISLWQKSGSEKGLKESFEKLGDDLLSAKDEYLKSRALDEEVFGQDYEV